jgi:hypothetical protein
MTVEEKTVEEEAGIKEVKENELEQSMKHKAVEEFYEVPADDKTDVEHSMKPKAVERYDEVLVDVAEKAATEEESKVDEEDAE